jgi:hypothetical protein
MIVRFEEQHGDVELTMEWAIAEGRDAVDDDDNVVVAQAIGTPGQEFRAQLMEKLFLHLRRQHS